MTPIANTRFQIPLGFQTSGGPEWSTGIVSLTSGEEVRNAIWAQPLRKWQLVGVPLNEGAANDLLKFFNARSGAAQGFRFSDPFGHSTARPGFSVSPLDEHLGQGDGVADRFFLTRDDGSVMRKPVTRPVAGSVRMAIDGTEVTDVPVDDATGEVTFPSPPAPGTTLTAGFDYDLPVRFETDRLELSQTSSGAFQLVRLSLVEIREALA